MPSKHELLQRLSSLAETEKQLWKSFRIAEVESRIGTFSLLKQMRVRERLPRETHWFARNHPVFMITALLTAIITPVLASPWRSFGFVFYGAFLVVAIVSKDKFVAAHAKNELRSTNITEHAFGIDNLSLSVFKVLNAKDLPALRKLGRDDIASLIKIVKASQEYLNTSYGYYDYARKAVIASIVALPVTATLLAYQNWQAIPGYADTAMQFVSSHKLLSPVPVALLLLLSAALAVLLYSLAFGDQRLERQKKRYLLMLNVIHEAWQS